MPDINHLLERSRVTGCMSERRNSQRTTTEVQATCRMGGRERRAIVYDVSSDGCMAEISGGSASAGGFVRVMFSCGIPAAGRVLWTDGSTAGIKFDHPLHPAVVAHLGFEFDGAAMSSVKHRHRFGRFIGYLRRAL